MHSVMLGDMALQGHSEYGEWLCESLDGWYETPAKRQNSSGYTGSDGESLVDEYFAGRYPTVDTTLFASTRHAILEARERLSAIGAMNDLVPLMVSEDGATSWSDVRSVGGVKMTRIKENIARFQIPLKASDPRRFGEGHSFTATVGTAVKVFHHGRYNGPLVLTVSGSGTLPEGYTVYGPGGRRLRVTRALLGDHRIDMEQALLTIGGVPYFGDISATQSDSWSVAPGEPQTMNVLPYPPDRTSTAQYTFTTYDAWI